MSSESSPRLRLRLDRLIKDLATRGGALDVTASGIAAALNANVSDILPMIFRAVDDQLLDVVHKDQCIDCGRVNGAQLDDDESGGYADCGTCGRSPHQRIVFFRPSGLLQVGQDLSRPKAGAAQSAASEADVAIATSAAPVREDRQDIQQQLLGHTKRVADSAERTEQFAQKTAENTWNLATDPKAKIGLLIALVALLVSTLLAIPGAINETKKLLGWDVVVSRPLPPATATPIPRTRLTVGSQRRLQPITVSPTGPNGVRHSSMPRE